MRKTEVLPKTIVFGGGGGLKKQQWHCYNE